MARIPTSLVIADLSSFARQLARALADSATPPSHLQFLNQIARAAGYRNLQALQAGAPQGAPAMAADVSPADPAPVDAAPAPLSDAARRALLQFDTAGRLQRWPAKYSVQRLILWPLWARFEPRRSYTEAEVNTVLKAANTFGDHVTLRRELVNHRLLARESDCSAYWKLPARPDDEARTLMAAWRERQRQRDGARALAPERQAARVAFTQRLRASGPSSAGSSLPG
ncbi:DUF2087 domain-containing protein [Ideonella dechloratans]|uniref:DUF2087 domain-containing protein n=1 Tax=Ideonella dechloratans TaxID=36863 RepID=A0A643FC98_IDEDE|nr:DUF2087 domain-containing protein [Ideonella dechloratans]KAB0582984.1 DUF2087 domain-containing protein [Ideonella dechloratans]UFU09618.1 DUF2087 domain-containing protein [Ideonella dechloratans]